MVFIAAEIGVNFRNLTEARRMIGLAKNAGADTVKFQIYSQEHVKGHPRQRELEEIILTPEKIKYLKQAADDCGIEFFATPYFPEAVDWLEQVGVKRYKIRYVDRYNSNLINTILKTNKQVLLSCDCDYLDDIIHNHKIFNPGTIDYIYCVPEYPPPLEKILFPYDFGDSLYTGYSNHYPSIVPPLVAAARGCEYLETHVKQDKYHNGYKPIDDAVSITFSQLTELYRLVREIEKIEW
ncbi:MAG: N-acetylneuraminate synthase family protein [Methanolobus sp.]|uniref:N-acetylneuraminate synthase family protein n=1 Tax=Methanolobus sp. TaxID=1874737 RepID=UPI00272F8703|nr:N-acetylneuraminate synthase family protein [Methanolobus sp.]MDP2217204.1 N-acetylneuraminate synthase family protein [Methanolobus sp.]